MRKFDVIPATTKRPTRAACYLRVSTFDQRPELQADETAALVEHRGWLLVDTFLDRGVSGTRDRRPELDRMMAAARRRQFDVLVVWRADRLFRSLPHMVQALGELAALGIEFVSCTEAFDTSTPQGRLLLHLVSAFADFEAGIIRERSLAGQAAARRRGVKFGRPRVAVDVPRALALRAAGRSLQEVALALGVGKATLHRALRAAEASGPDVGGVSGSRGAVEVRVLTEAA